MAHHYLTEPPEIHAQACNDFYGLAAPEFPEHPRRYKVTSLFSFHRWMKGFFQLSDLKWPRLLRQRMNTR